MIHRAAVCPGAPMLIPGLADALRAEVPELVEACDRAVACLRSADRVLLLSAGPTARDEGLRAQHLSMVHPAGTRLSSALLTGSSRPAIFTGRLAGAPAGPGPLPSAHTSPGVGVIVGAALLARAGSDAPLTAIDLADGPTPADARAAAAGQVDAVLAAAVTSADRVGLLVVAEGSASRGPASPGGGSGRAQELDASLAAALAAGDPAALAKAANLDPAQAARLLFTSGPALRALAELTAARPPQDAQVLLEGAPFGVGYLVSTWFWNDGD